MGIALSKTARDLIRSGLFGKDYDTYRTEISDYINQEFGTEIGSNIMASEMGIVLIEMVSFALSTASWYGDRQADETTLKDVRLRENAIAIARQLGYVPSGSIPAVVEITMTIVSPTVLGADLTIEKGRQLKASTGSTWEVAETVVFSAGGSLTQTIFAREGQTLEEVFISSGEENQVFELGTIPANMSIAQDSVVATVDNENWPVVALSTYDQVNQVEVGYGFNPPRVIFGDGNAGNIPKKDVNIVINYFVTSGTAGSVASNVVTTFAEPLVAGSTPVVATLTHDAPSTTGSDPEVIDKIKTVAPQVYQNAKRSVTLTDFDGIINSYVDPTYGAVAKGRANVPRGTSGDAEALTIISLVNSLATQLATVQPSAAASANSVTTRLRTYWDKVLSSNCKANVVIAQILSSDNQGRYVKASSGLASSLENYLDSIVGGTVKVKVTDGSINLFSINISADIKLESTYRSKTAQNIIKETLRNLLQQELINRDYGTPLRISDLYKLVESIQGIDYGHLNIVVKDSFGVDVTTTKVNQYSDVIIQDYEVLTMGTVPEVNLIG